MSESDHEWVAELPITGRAAENLGFEYDSIEDLIQGYRQADDFTEIRRIGEKSAHDLYQYIQEQDPDAKRVRHDNDDGICTEFTLDVYDIEGVKVTFGFICPRCEHVNELQGHPDGFKNKPFACMNCRWVSLLYAGAIERFIEEAGIDE